MSVDPGVEAAWAVLGLTADADRDQVTRAYRRLALSTHPDVSPPPGCRGPVRGGRQRISSRR